MANIIKPDSAFILGITPFIYTFHLFIGNLQVSVGLITMTKSSNSFKTRKAKKKKNAGLK